jgi:AbrB family looped-hinge helix DNA binding protein
MGKPKLVRVQEKGQITLPVEIRRKLGLKPGDYVTVTDGEHGALIQSRRQALIAALDELGEMLREPGRPDEEVLEEYLEAGRVIREEIAREMYPFLYEK